MVYHVSVSGSDHAAGTLEAPFRTINHAAQIALPGDIVQVHTGEYREWIDPKYGGLNDANRIIYEAAPGERPVIKGSEIVTDWDQVEGSIWKKELPNTMFGEWNPYQQIIDGDWIEQPREYNVHLGDVYLNGQSMFEAPSMEALYRAEIRTRGCHYPWDTAITYPEKTIYQWFAQVDETSTTIWCNFQDVDPNSALTEINVRQCCFYPTETGINYITLRGFEIAHAASPWAPPTADQPGMVGPHWAKGWIIEGNHLHDAKCNAVSLGKEISTGHNMFTRIRRKPGYNYQMETVFLALRAGWSKETIGSHIVRNNTIHDCGQTGIVGHMGCIFSRIEHNHIYNIAKKHEFWGHEIAGIKLHAAIDVVIENNNIHDCSLGTWLDWQIQGTRLTRNVYHHNDRDLKIEVSHGPCLLDHNLFLSDYSVDNSSQGSAFVHNLILGAQYGGPAKTRSTPYHFPHSTEVAGCIFGYGGDDRVLNNLFAEHHPVRTWITHYSSCFDQYTTPEEYWERIWADGRERDHQTFEDIPQPVWIEENAYAGYSTPFRAEKNPIDAEGLDASIVEDCGKWVLTLNIPESVSSANCQPVTTERLGTPRIVEQLYENPDGTPIDFTHDFFGTYRSATIIPGPFAALQVGHQELIVWED